MIAPIRLKVRWPLALLGLLVVATQAGAGDRVAIRVNPSITYAPANLFVRTTVEARAENRRLVVTADSPTYYRSSEVQLDGELAPRVAYFQFRGLPAGEYNVRATVRDARGAEIARSEVQANVIGDVDR